MKSVFAGLFFLSVFINIYSQTDYKVIKVNGNITIKTKGTQLQTGTVFSEKDELLFKTDDATAAVVNSVKGRMILTGRRNDLSSASVNFLPAMYNISSRGFTAFSTLSEFHNYFSGKYVLLESQVMLVNRKSFHLDNENFFYIQYVFNGEEINKKVNSSGDSLIIDRKSLFTIDGNPVKVPDSLNVIFFYRNGENLSIVSNFELILPDLKQIKNEIAIIIDELKGRSKKAITNEINSYVVDNYGNIDRDNLEHFLNLNFPEFD